jgi:hypothetical protein
MYYVVFCMFKFSELSSTEGRVAHPWMYAHSSLEYSIS